MNRTGRALGFLVAALLASFGLRATAYGSDVEIDRAAAAARLGEAIRLRTISQQGGGIADAAAFQEFHRLLERNYPAAHAELQRAVIAQHSLLYSWGESAEPAVLFAAHLDVVPVEAAEQWAVEPFAGTVDDEFVWGRGALDDKSSLIGLMEAVEGLVRSGFRPKGRVYLAFGHDEENDGAGARAIAAELERRGERVRMVLDEGGFVLDGIIPDVERPVATVGIAEKGFLSVELRVDGDGGHSSVPPRTTAVGRIANAVARLERTPMRSRLTPVVRAQLQGLAPALPWAQRFALSQSWLFGGLVRRSLESRPETAATVRTTTAVTMIRGGVKGNVLPRQARAVVNFRILPGDSVADVLAHVKRTVADERVEIRKLGRPAEPSPASSPDSPAYAAIAAMTGEVFPDALVTPSLVVGMTDARSYEPVADDVYRFLPLRGDRDVVARIHGTDERISIDAYAGMIRFYVGLIAALDGGES